MKANDQNVFIKVVPSLILGASIIISILLYGMFFSKKDDVQDSVELPIWELMGAWKGGFIERIDPLGIKEIYNGTITINSDGSCNNYCKKVVKIDDANYTMTISHLVLHDSTCSNRKCYTIKKNGETYTYFDEERVFYLKDDDTLIDAMGSELHRVK